MLNPQITDAACVRLRKAIELIGRDTGLRDTIVDALRAFEATHDSREANYRDEVTGPIADALYRRDDVVTRTLEDGLVFECLYRSKIARDLILSRASHPDHVFEPQTTRLNVHLARLADHVLVGGAYAGDQVLPIAKALRARGGTCHAFDADPDQLAMLRRNAAANGLDNIALNHRALWSEDGVELVLVGDDALAHVEPADRSGAGVKSMTIDTYGEQAGIRSFGLIQLDMEGSELAALRGASRYLSQTPGEAPNVVFEIHRDYVDWSEGLGRTDIVRLLAGYGYILHAVRDYQSNVPMQDSPVELVPIESVVLEGPSHGFNILAVKDPALLTDTLFRTCRDVSPKLLDHKDPRLHHPRHRV